MSDGKVWACTRLVRILAKVLFQPRTESEAKGVDMSNVFISRPWYEFKTLIRFEDLDRILRPWYDFKTLLWFQDLDMIFRPWYDVKTLLWSHLSLESPRHSAQHTGFGLCCPFSLWTHFRICTHERNARILICCKQSNVIGWSGSCLGGERTW